MQDVAATSAPSTEATFERWVRCRMRALGIRTIRQLAAEVGVTEKTISDVVRRPELRRDPSILLWLSRVLLVEPHLLKALRTGDAAFPPDHDRVRWSQYEKNRGPRTEDHPGVPPAVTARFRELVADDPEHGLARAMQLYVAAHEVLGRRPGRPSNS